MNKKTKTVTVAEVSPSLDTTITTYSVARCESGYSVFKHEIINGKLVSSIRDSEPNMLVLTLAVLAIKIRKDLGV